MRPTKYHPASAVANTDVMITASPEAPTAARTTAIAMTLATIKRVFEMLATKGRPALFRPTSGTGRT